MSQIYDLPQPNNAGLNFNYEVWNENAVITLCNVPWNSDYRDVTTANVDTYINGLTDKMTLNNLSYLKAFAPIRVPHAFDKVSRFNYIRVTNPVQPVMGGDVGKVYYYFITDIQYVGPNTTQINIQLDVFTTFHHTIDFGNVYIEQGHVGIANENQLNYGGREYLTVPEGLNMGESYVTHESKKTKLASLSPYNYTVMLVSTTDLTADPGTTDAPILESARGSLAERLPSGADIFFFQDPLKFRAFMENYSNKPWVTQGIISITVVPNPIRWGLSLVPVSGSPIDGLFTISDEDQTNPNFNQIFPATWRQTYLDTLGKYSHLKKFSVSPYCVFEVTSYNGTPLILKPELWNTRNPDSENPLVITELAHIVPPGQRIVMYPQDYAHSGGGLSRGDYIDTSTGIFNFPMFSVVNNGYANYLASTVNSRAYSQESASWSQSKALQGNVTAFGQANNSIDTTSQMTEIGVNQTNQVAGQQNQTAAFGAATSAIGGFAGGPAAGAANLLGQGANLAIGINNTNNMAAISNSAANARTGAANRNAGYMRDTNKGFADFAANGDYQNAIAGINAQVQDAKMTPASTSGQIGGDAFNIATDMMGYEVKLKSIDRASLASIGDYWLRYGYRIDRFGIMPENLHCMTKFTYWKLKETYITSSFCPELYRQTIRGIFEKGVTVWSNPNDIGRTDLHDNLPLPGITL